MSQVFPQLYQYRTYCRHYESAPSDTQSSRFAYVVICRIVAAYVFHRLDYKMQLKINSEVVKRRVMNVCVGSGPGYGQTPNAVPYNGMVDVSVVYSPKIIQLFVGIWLLFTGRFLSHHSVHAYRTDEVHVIEAKHAMLGIDGRLMSTPVGSYWINVDKEVINFLIPD